MGMATKAPKPGYRRKFDISDHAGERFRERVDEEFKHRSDHDLGNMLDDKLRGSEHPMTVRDPRAPEALTRLYPITMRRATFYVVVRGDTAITVLDESQARNNFADAWKPTLNAPFADALRNFRPATKLTEVGPREVRLVDAVYVLPTPPPSPPPPSQLDDAGVAYARALRVQRDTRLAVDQAKAQVERAKADLTKAEEAANLAAHEVVELRERLEMLALET